MIHFVNKPHKDLTAFKKSGDLTDMANDQPQSFSCRLLENLRHLIYFNLARNKTLNEP